MPILKINKTCQNKQIPLKFRDFLRRAAFCIYHEKYLSKQQVGCTIFKKNKNLEIYICFYTPSKL